MKIARHVNAWVSAPPSAGPIAVLTSTTASHSWRCGRSPVCSSANAATSAPAPPIAWIPRPTSRTSNAFAREHSTEASANTRKPPTPTAR